MPRRGRTARRRPTSRRRAVGGGGGARNPRATAGTLPAGRPPSSRRRGPFPRRGLVLAVAPGAAFGRQDGCGGRVAGTPLNLRRFGAHPCRVRFPSITL